MKAGVAKLLEHLDPDPSREGLADTPRRVADAFIELTQGTYQDPQALLGDGFAEACDEMVVVKDISFVSLCEHHLMPFHGTVAIGYIPAGRVVGLSKLARLTECFARRLQMQERMTNQIADALTEKLNPVGVGVMVEGFHACMAFRGIRNGGRTITSAMRGALMEKPEARAEFMALARQ